MRSTPRGRLYGLLALAAVAIAVLGGALVAAGAFDGGGSPATTEATPPPATNTPIRPEPTPTPTATAPATATAESATGEDRCEGVDERGEELAAAIEATLAGYDGTWGFALVDVDCDASVIVNPLYAQYPASAGKIVTVIAALRAVEAGLLEFETIEDDLDLVLTHSLDANATAVNDLLTQRQVAEVLEIAGVSERTQFDYYWYEVFMPPHDLALVWAALLRGELLGEEWTAFLLEATSQAVIPEGSDTFPAELGVPGYEYGQKAGYWISEEEPYAFAGAGYIRPEHGRSAGFAIVLLLRADDPDVFEPQRRTVFPFVRDYVISELEPGP